MTQPTAMPTATIGGVVSGAQVASQMRLAVTSLRESTLAAVAKLQATINAHEAAAVDLGMDKQTIADYAQAREALAALQKAVQSASGEVESAFARVEKAWEKHHPIVEEDARVGGLAKPEAYKGN